MSGVTRFLNSKIKSILPNFHYIVCSDHKDHITYIGKLYINVRLFGLVKMENRRLAIKGYKKSNRVAIYRGMSSLVISQPMLMNAYE